MDLQVDNVCTGALVYCPHIEASSDAKEVKKDICARMHRCITWWDVESAVGSFKKGPTKRGSSERSGCLCLAYPQTVANELSRSSSQ